MEKIGVLLMNLGGPERITDVGPFLYNCPYNDVSNVCFQSPYFLNGKNRRLIIESWGP